MSKLIIESTNLNDSPVDIEETLQKAVDSIQLSRDNNKIEDHFLKTKLDEANDVASKVFSSMLDEISEVLNGGGGNA